MANVMKWVFALGVFGIPCASFADQCAWVTADPAARLIALDKSGRITGNRFVEYCKSCGDTAPKGPYTITKLKHKRIDQTYTEFSFVVAGKDMPVDLAYVFIQASPSKYINLGKEISCLPTIDNSSELNLK